MRRYEHTKAAIRRRVPGPGTDLDRTANAQSNLTNERNDSLRESKFKSYQDLPLTLTAPEVGEVLGISRAAAYELVRSKGFPHMKIGTRILVPKDKFIQWIEDQTEINSKEDAY